MVGGDGLEVVVVGLALDALVELLKQKMPSLKKKKGVVPPALKSLESDIWVPLKESIRALAA